MPRFAPLLILPLLAAVGCGSGYSVKPPTTVAVSGKVVNKAGKGIAGVKVTFRPQFDMGSVKWEPSGVTDKDGKFALTTGTPQDGAPPGEYKVLFEWMTVGKDNETEVDYWKGKYANPATAPTVTISSPAELEPFTLD